MKLDELRLAAVRDEAESVHSETVNVTERSRKSVASHRPEKSMQRARLLAEEVPCRIVSCRCLGDLVIAAGLDGVDQVGELNCVLNEEDWDIVSDDICEVLVGVSSSSGDMRTEISFIGVEACRESVHIARCIGTASTTSNGREPHEHGCFFILFREERCGCDV
jgi:hypothetical protein